MIQRCPLGLFLDRLASSAERFGFDLGLDEVRRRLEAIEARSPQRVRLVVGRDGSISIAMVPVNPTIGDPWSACESCDLDDHIGLPDHPPGSGPHGKGLLDSFDLFAPCISFNVLKPSDNLERTISATIRPTLKEPTEQC